MVMLFSLKSLHTNTLPSLRRRKKKEQQMYTLKCQSILYKEGGDEKRKM